MDGVRVFLLSPDAIPPQRAEEGSIGYDVFAPENVVIPGGGKRKAIPTKIVIAFEGDCYARIAPRSGLALRQGIDVVAGVVDSSYRGEIVVLLMNHGQDYEIRKGDRIAQIIFEKAYTPKVTVVQSASELGQTKRGEGGFGSSGV